MREIKFRVRWKRKDGKVFTQIYDWADFVAGTMHYCDGEIISRDQFTGLHDKNGKKIWEGDRVEVPTGPHAFAIGVIVYHNAAFMVELKDGTKIYLEGYGWEVIGNIYENPGLVTKKVEVD